MVLIPTQKSWLIAIQLESIGAIEPLSLSRSGHEDFAMKPK
jgi:hypothetical protein